jgi:hypothetical protein
MRIELLRVFMKFLPIALSSEVLPGAKPYTTLGSKSASQHRHEQGSPRCGISITLTLPAEAALRAIQATFGCPAAMTPLQVLGGGSCMNLIVGITGPVLSPIGGR